MCEQKLKPLGFRPVDVDFRAAHRSLVRIYIERLAENKTEIEEEEERS